MGSHIFISSRYQFMKKIRETPTAKQQNCQFFSNYESASHERLVQLHSARTEVRAGCGLVGSVYQASRQRIVGAKLLQSVSSPITPMEYQGHSGSNSSDLSNTP